MRAWIGLLVLAVLLGGCSEGWLSYETAYELGIATEQFVWVFDGEKTRLDGCQINSKELILR